MRPSARETDALAKPPSWKISVSSAQLENRRQNANASRIQDHLLTESTTVTPLLLEVVPQDAGETVPSGNRHIIVAGESGQPEN
jgi:hypothetical protein